MTLERKCDHCGGMAGEGSTRDGYLSLNLVCLTSDIGLIAYDVIGASNPFDGQKDFCSMGCLLAWLKYEWPCFFASTP
jgi:hypothetical protein